MMFEYDGTQTSWLVYADFLEDNDLSSEGIRGFEVQVNDWEYQQEFSGVGANHYILSKPDQTNWVGCLGTVVGVSSYCLPTVGSYYNSVGGNLKFDTNI